MASSSVQDLLFDVGFRPEALLILQMSDAELQEASFLDQRILQGLQVAPRWVRADAVQRQLQNWTPDRPASFIFHQGHVGSTLLSRLIGNAPNVLSLREPQVLRTLAQAGLQRNQPSSLVSPGRFADLLSLATKMMARPLGARSQPVVKATSIASLLADDIAEATGASMLGMTIRADRYLAAIMGQEGNRREAVSFAPLRRQMIARHMPGASFAVHELGEGELVAMAWLAGALDLSALVHVRPERTMLLDFDDFLAEPAPRFERAARHLGADMTAEQAATAVAGPLMSRYSKAQEHGFSAAQRSQVLDAAIGEHGEEIGRGLAWLDRMANHHPAAAQALETVGARRET